MFGFLRKWWSYLLVVFSVVGPGIITASADNDAGGISTYSIVGGRYGYSLLWALFLIVFSLGITQEMGMRLGIVSGKGLAALIREKFGVKLTFFAVVVMLLANLGTLTAEFSGIAASFGIFGVSKYLVVPISAVIVWLVLYKGSFKLAQRIFLTLSAFYIVYVITAFKIQPDFGAALQALITPSFRFDAHFILAMIAIVGTTITPWGQFFIQSYVVDKGIHLRHLSISRREAYVGAFLTGAVAFFIIVTAANTIFKNGLAIQSAGDAAAALRPLAGSFAQALFAFGLFCASMLGAFILPVATAYAVCEALGWESGFDLKWHQGRNFYGLIILAIVLPAAIVLLPRVNLMSVVLITQAINGALLPIILIYLMRLVNDKRLMGEYANGLIVNALAWLTIIALIAASLVLAAASFFPKLNL